MIGMCRFGRSASRSCAAANTGDSSSVSRTHRPTKTSTAESRNATRQPQLLNASSLSVAASTHSTAAESRLPAGTPAWANDVQNPRRAASPCSAAISTAPPHSPPTAKPWISRHRISSSGARIPTCAYVGSSPIANVPAPIITSEITSIRLRPMRSP